MDAKNHARFMQILREKERLGAGMSAQEMRLMKMVARRDKLNANKKRTPKQEEALVALRLRIEELKRKMRAQVNGAGRKPKKVVAAKKPAVKNARNKHVVIPKKHEAAMIRAAKGAGMKGGFLPQLLAALPAILGAVPSIVGLFKSDDKPVEAERSVPAIDNSYIDKRVKKAQKKALNKILMDPRDHRGRSMQGLPLRRHPERGPHKNRVRAYNPLKSGYGAANANPWLAHVKAFWRAHPHLSYMQAMQEARASYK